MPVKIGIQNKGNGSRFSPGCIYQDILFRDVQVAEFAADLLKHPDQLI